MTKIFTYKTILIKGPNKWIYAEFPFDSIKEFGTRRTIRVKVKFEGQPFEMSLLPNGKGGHWLHVRKEIRTAVGKDEGDSISIELEKDNTTKIVEVPEYLQWLLDDDPVSAAYFEKLSYSAKKIWVAHIEEPKNNDSKVERVNRLFEYLREHYSGKNKINPFY
ncbi:MAG: DUF1905 domain-containing protein [Bacteroidetes bacterium]|nr:DUF1905 domain-containing protein [Bacteroidota bacterium]